MPYIPKEQRTKIAFMSDYGGGVENELLIYSSHIDTPGDLNYAITVLLKDYVNNNGYSYNTFNKAVGVLECCKLEMYRRAVAPYEDEKIAENGDVYP